MVCIYCGNSTSVINSRLQKRVNQVWRRRKCQACGAVFSTQEQATLESALTVKKEGSSVYEPFLRDKLLLSVYQSCAHRKTAIEDARAITQTIIGKLDTAASNGSVSSQDIANHTLEVLKHFDQAAMVHYQAFHPSP